MACLEKVFIQPQNLEFLAVSWLQRSLLCTSVASLYFHIGCYHLLLLSAECTHSLGTLSFSLPKQYLMAFKNSSLNWSEKAKCSVKRHDSLNFEDISLFFQELWKHNYRKDDFPSFRKSWIPNMVVTKKSYLSDDVLKMYLVLQ